MCERQIVLTRAGGIRQHGPVCIRCLIITTKKKKIIIINR